ncbi:transporter [Ganoderma sinense ZZ0214-1]|uniref:Polyadenylation factor subunit 2 n=1 Tax=Ganoderma sinense ZZ0214-1 TaxID=1077348 RepID=A0A2G8SGX6_9APHY|nr:transporter [Ganoderma sinense ZZ0214-1]
MASADPLPLLLPARYIPSQDASKIGWTPKRDLEVPNQPPPEDPRALEMDMARQLADGKPVKKVRPRRTVDYGGAMGRWILLRKMRPNSTYVPQLRPAPPWIIDLLPPKAYPNNPSTSLCTKFVHTSTNKIRCPVNCVVWTPEARRILTGSTSGEFTLWNGLTFNFETILQAHDSAVRTMQFTHSGAFLASADQSGVIKYFQPNMNNLTQWTGHREAIRGLSFSPDDNRFATASDDSTIRLWSFEEQRAERTLTGHGWDVKCVEWHPTKGLLVSGSKDNMIKFWDPRTATVLSTLHYHKNTVQALAWSPNGDLVASASRDQTVRVFDIRAMKELRLLKGHKKEVCSVTWHPFHPLLVSGGSEGAILHWDLSSSSEPPPPRRSPSSPDLAQRSRKRTIPTSGRSPSTRWGTSSSARPTTTPTRFWTRTEEAMVPGFGMASAGNGWWGGKEEDGRDGPSGSGAPGLSAIGGQAGAMDTSDDMIPGLGGGIPGLGGFDGGGSASAASVVGRQSGPLPSQEDMFGHGDREPDTYESRGGRGRRWGRGGHGGDSRDGTGGLGVRAKFFRR